MYNIYLSISSNYHKPMASEMSGSNTTGQHTTGNISCCVAQSNITVTTTCKTISFYELYNKSSQASNATLYVTSNDIWSGRLGNQMFKYASLLGISRTQGRRMFIEPGTSLEKTFKISYVAVNESTKLWPVVKQEYFFHDKLMNLPLQNVKIQGYTQSFWYFAAVMDEIRQEFTFHDSIANDAAKIVREVYVKYNSSMIVGVHVRRGDFLTERHKRMGYGVAEKSYFMKAFGLMKSKFPGRDIVFLVASDDLKWCSENLLGDNVSIMPPASSAVHLAVLSKCEHMIISGGTYGWWSGWLANGYVIYYTGYMEKGTPLGNRVNRYHYYPRMWTGLGN
ncbi:unnamed protein product [Candidula unifasciata]|uniref:L-Fucosyltransferase n=1 Tax=Candidula unifasciata TaxID=100452 RepID=A0A8S3YMV4_9EUPU|nr:unnamed protein product [Candidula unifasciata]